MKQDVIDYLMSEPDPFEAATVCTDLNCFKWRCDKLGEEPEPETEKRWARHRIEEYCGEYLTSKAWWKNQGLPGYPQDPSINTREEGFDPIAHKNWYWGERLNLIEEEERDEKLDIPYRRNILIQSVLLGFQILTLILVLLVRSGLI